MKTSTLSNTEAAAALENVAEAIENSFEYFLSAESDPTAIKALLQTARKLRDDKLVMVDVEAVAESMVVDWKNDEGGEGWSGTLLDTLDDKYGLESKVLELVGLDGCEYGTSNGEERQAIAKRMGWEIKTTA